MASALTFALSPAFAASVFSGIDTDNDGTIDLERSEGGGQRGFRPAR